MCVCVCTLPSICSTGWWEQSRKWWEWNPECNICSCLRRPLSTENTFSWEITLRVSVICLFFYPKIWADVKTKTKTIAKAHTYGDVERSSPAQVGLVIRTSTASITRSILPRRLRLWVCCQCDVSLSSVWRQRWAAGTGSQWLSVRALKELRNHTPPHCHPHVTLVPLYRTNACEKHSARWRNHQVAIKPSTLGNRWIYYWYRFLSLNRYSTKN